MQWMTRSVLAASLMLALSWTGNAYADGHEADANARAAKVIGDLFIRSMANWRYDYGGLDTTKAGVACIPWDKIDQEFLEVGEFKGLGFSYSIATEEYAVKVATDGCERMVTGLKLDDCVCQTVMKDDTPVVFVPQAVRDRLGLE